MTAPVTLELKPEEVEYLNSLRRCALCDHLGALHHEAHEEDEDDHCAECAEQNCHGGLSFFDAECSLPQCHCTGYK